MTAQSTRPAAECSPRARVTKSLLGYGVIVGPFYVLASVVQGLLTPGFSFSRDSWSTLSLGGAGWVHVAVFIVTGLMLLAAAVGFRRHLAGQPGSGSSIWLGAYGVLLLVAGLATPDPTGGSFSAHGAIHLAAGGLGFVAFSVASFLLVRRFRSSGAPRLAAFSVAAGVVLLAGFVGIAAAGTSPFGVLGLTVAVLVSWAWLTTASLRLYAEAAEIGRAEALHLASVG